MELSNKCGMPQLTLESAISDSLNIKPLSNVSMLGESSDAKLNKYDRIRLPVMVGIVNPEIL
ncbi:MAG: hypothetical protein LBT47_03385 [Deltaproteobacteria bacterium]|nr:hypothetical protein [Deltaproteobacteria bacterium]